MLYLFAVFFGLGTGGISVLASPLVAKLFGLNSHGLILGILSLGITIGGSVGPLFAGYIFDVTGGYQVAFLVCVGIGIVGLISTIVFKPIKSTYGQNKASYIF